MMTNIVPGACFQRRRACLDIVQAWLEAIIFMEADGAKKGKALGGFCSLFAQLNLVQFLSMWTCIHAYTKHTHKVQLAYE